MVQTAGARPDQELLPRMCLQVIPNFTFALAKESEDKENLPKRTSSGGFKFTFSHSASAANGANSANSKCVVAQTAAAHSNGSSSKTAGLAASVTATKVRALAQQASRFLSTKSFHLY